MFSEKTLTRIFFVFAFSVFCGAGAQRMLAQDEFLVDETDRSATCLDGNRKECWHGPVGGGTMTKYWV